MCYNTGWIPFFVSKKKKLFTIEKRLSHYARFIYVIQVAIILYSMLRIDICNILITSNFYFLFIYFFKYRTYFKMLPIRFGLLNKRQ